MAQVDGRTESARERVGALLLEVLPDLRAFARSLAKDRTWADDLVQETIVKALGSCHQFQIGTNFKAWTFTILRNTFYSQHRKNDRYTCLPELHEIITASGQEERLWMSDFIRAFQQLSPDHREILTLLGPSDLSYVQAAEVCGCAVGTVKSRANRARNELLRILETKGPEISRREMLPISDAHEVGTAVLPGWLGVEER